MPFPVRRLVLTLAMLPVALAVAAQEPAVVTAATGTSRYLPEDFARYAPKSALDMLRQVPGFVIREAVQERGLGQATGNVLINGKRVSGKSNDVLAELARMPAGDVSRIDIVDGATLDIPGLSGPVANVIAKAGGLSGQWAWRPEFRSYYTDPLLTRGEVSVSGARGAIDYTLGLQNNANHSGAGGDTRLYNADRSFREYRNEAWTGENDAPRASGRLTYGSPQGLSANLNASYQRAYYDFLETGTRSGPALPTRSRRVEESERGFNYELSGDVEFDFASGKLKLIGLNHAVHTPSSQTVLTEVLDGSTADTGSRFERVSDERERIARAEYRWKQGVNDWQVSSEAAFNSLDTISALYALQPDGRYEPLPLPGATATVKEDRYEVMGSMGRPLTASTVLQLTAGAEHSYLRQAGGGGLSRTFLRPKGSVSLAWTASPVLDINMKLQRRVGQLNFYDFLSSVNLGDGRQNAGNPDLVPQQSWELEVEANRKLGAFGSTGLRVYAQRIDDIVDTIPIGADGESPGNIDRARVAGIEWKSTLQLDAVGWRGAKVDARLQLEDSEVRDPLTGDTRPISNQLMRLGEIGLRHDVPDTDWAWGSELSYQYSARDYRLSEVGRRWEGPVWGSLFVEHKNVRGLTVRASASNVFGAMSMWDRTVFEGRRTGPVAYFEQRDRRIGPIFSFSVSGKF